MLKAAHRHSCSSSRITYPLACHRRPNVGWLLMLVCGLTALSFAAPNDSSVLPSDPSRYRSGLRNSSDRHQLNAKQLAAVLESLRAKTGFLDMHFDEQGFLSLGDRSRVAGGSVSARALLVAAVEGHKAIALENHSHSTSVAFARTGSTIIYESRATGARIEVQSVDIDFSDFLQLQGQKEARAAFDLGFVLLHELGHCALDLHDAENSPDEIGECENYINRIRRELGIPEREHYAARIQQAPIWAGQSKAQRAELTFLRVVDKQGQAKTESLSLSWESEKVSQGVVFKPTSVAAAAGQQ